MAELISQLINNRGKLLKRKIMKDSKIQWTDDTVNFWHGCKKVSDGCKFCYMYRDKERYGQDATTILRSGDTTFYQALKWKEGRKIFTCSWSDFFIAEADGWRADAWDVIRKTPQHQWQILTKRPERIKECLPPDWGEGWDNVWIGVSVESQKYISRVSQLCQIPAITRFVSAEPLIGEIDFSVIEEDMKSIHWCIIGGESGNTTGKHLFRECEMEWIEKIITYLKETSVKIFVKQTGTFIAAAMKYKDRHGGDMDEWPSQIQIREFPHDNPVPSSTVLNFAQKDTSIAEDLDPLRATPTFPDVVYNNLPDLLVRATEHFTDKREKDLVLSSCLVILSGCFTSCKGMYHRKDVGPNLYGFVVAPAASGKASMEYSKLLGYKIQNNCMTKYKMAKEEYEVQMRKWNKNTKGTDEDKSEPPAKPKSSVHFIPGNSTSASIYNLLDNNGGIGTICETEADTLASAIKKEWGDFSSLLRLAFHHENASVSRSKGDLYISVENPHLSILLTGTPGQVTSLIRSAEDGLSSRFLYYCYSRKLEWINPESYAEDINLCEEFKSMGSDVAAIKDLLDKHKNQFGLSKQQFESLSNNFKAKLERVKRFEGDNAGSAVFRMGLITFRIAMILSILRNSSVLEQNIMFQCSDDDFNTALKITDVLFEHSMVLFSLLPKQVKNVSNPKMGEFYSLLPQDKQFKRNHANKIGTQIGISEKSVGNYLTTLSKDGQVANPKFGIYKKTKSS